MGYGPTVFEDFCIQKANEYDLQEWLDYFEIIINVNDKESCKKAIHIKRKSLIFELWE